MPLWRSDANVLAHSSPGRKNIVLAGDFCFLKGEMAVCTSCSSAGTTPFAI